MHERKIPECGRHEKNLVAPALPVYQNRFKSMLEQPSLKLSCLFFKEFSEIRSEFMLDFQ